MTRAGFWRDLWALVHPYWQSEDKLSAWMLLIAIVALTLGMVYMDVQFNTWRAVRVPGELHERGQQLVGADKAPKDP